MTAGPESSLAQSLVKDLRAGDPRALARLITWVENRSPGYRDVLDEVYPYTGLSYRIGLTGPPGAGKSSLAAKLIPRYRAEGRRVAVLACDPTSPFSGGALFGDRIRMQDLGTDEGVFIRSMATRGSLGGLARSATEAMLLVEAAGFDLVMLETIGVGQVEVDVVRAADTVVLVLVPQSGDVVQAMKAGLMEIADVFAVNKSDQGEAELACVNIQTALSLTQRDWLPPIVKTVALSGEGIPELKSAVASHRAHLGQLGLVNRRRQQLRSFLQELIESDLSQQLWDKKGVLALNDEVEKILRHESAPFRSAQELLQRINRQAFTRS